MSSTTIPASFDPFAMHPFTNGSGLVPQPPPPSQYRTIPIPSPRRPPAFSATHNEYFDGGYSTSSSLSSDSSSFSSQSPISSMHAPQPRRRPTSTSPSRCPSSPQEPIFVTFRKESASPELVLKKKAPKMKNASTQTPPEMSS